MKHKLSNRFKTALKNHQPQIGFWLSMASPYSAEMCASTGFQWLLIDGEHAPNDMRSILAQLQAVTPFDAAPVVRLPDGNPTLIKQALDIGAHTLLIPMVDDAEQAQALVRAMRYPPQGIRGVGAAATRASLWNGVQNYTHDANNQVCLLVQVESVTALRNVESICAVDGVDGVFIGPADLAASTGYIGNPGHPQVQKAIETCIQKIVASGKSAGTLTSDPALAKRYLELGADFVAVGLDLSLMLQAVRQRAAEFGLEQERGKIVETISLLTLLIGVSMR